jgi:hypothetical protein
MREYIVQESDTGSLVENCLVIEYGEQTTDDLFAGSIALHEAAKEVSNADVAGFLQRVADHIFEEAIERGGPSPD